LGSSRKEKLGPIEKHSHQIQNNPRRRRVKMAAYYRGRSNFQSGKPKRQWNPAWANKEKKVVPGSMFKPLTNPDPAQVAIFDNTLNDPKSLIVVARAGTGKTTVCTNTMHKLPPEDLPKSGYIIFAKRNAQEAVGKCPAEIGVCKTAHSFGLSIIAKRFGKVQVDKHKEDRIAEAILGLDDEQADARYMLTRGMSIAQDYLAQTVEEVIAACEKHGIEFGELSETEFASKVLEGVDMSMKQTNVVGFANMVAMPLLLNLNIPRLKFLWADELQDLNRSKMILILKACEGGKLIGVGDNHQAIMGFSGADRHSMQFLREKMSADTLPLFKTYRCAKAIVEYAKQWCPDYEAAETNVEGLVESCNAEKMMKEARGGDFLLSRINAPLVPLAMQFLKEGRKCNIQGNDLGANLLFMIKRSKTSNVADFCAWLEDWKSAEIERLTKKKKDYEWIEDKAACLEAFCEGERSLEVVKEKIERLFDKDEDDQTKENNRITLSSCHKSKGLERERTWLLQSSFVCKAKTEEEKEQEDNVRYVSATRSKSELYLVD
jgi:superfamily I DNA/RNA helicase